ALGADAVKVGTWARSKGMEFAHVFLPQVDRTTQLLTGAGKSAEQEKAELLRRTLYVAMTRARDTLWVGKVGPEA
ncbi:MAG: pcrA, partial [Frankiales bacterium]|nr:pcrA [Frankiales bacterium]